MGGVDALLEAGEGLVVVHDGLGGREAVGQPGALTPEIGIGVAEAAEGPFAGDEFVDEEARLGGGRLVVVVVFGFELIEAVCGLPGEDFVLGEDATLEIGGDDAGFAFGGDGAVGLASILAGRGDLEGVAKK